MLSRWFKINRVWRSPRQNEHSGWNGCCTHLKRKEKTNIINHTRTIMRNDLHRQLNVFSSLVAGTMNIDSTRRVNSTKMKKVWKPGVCSEWKNRPETKLYLNESFNGEKKLINNQRSVGENLYISNVWSTIKNLIESSTRPDHWTIAWVWSTFRDWWRIKWFLHSWL